MIPAVHEISPFAIVPSRIFPEVIASVPIVNTPTPLNVPSPLNAVGLKFVPSAIIRYPAVLVPMKISSPETVRSPPAVNIPVPVVIALFVVVLIPSVPVPVISSTVEFPASVIPVELIVVRPVPVVNVPDHPIVVLPVRVIPPEPDERFNAVAPVVLPTVTVFADPPVPTFTAPVDPESRFNAPVVPDVTERAEPAAEERVSVLSVVIVVAPVPVRVAAPAARDRRVLPPVLKSRPKASVVPSVAVVP